MTRRVLIAGLFGCVLMSGCTMPASRTKEVERSVDEYEIVGIRPPKHFYLDLKNVKTGEVHKQVYVSKHYNEHRKLSVGMKITITRTLWEYSDGSQRWSFNNTEIKEACDKLVQQQ